MWCDMDATPKSSNVNLVWEIVTVIGIRMLIMPRIAYITAIMSTMLDNDNIKSEHSWFIRIIGDQKRQPNDHQLSIPMQMTII